MIPSSPIGGSTGSGHPGWPARWKCQVRCGIRRFSIVSPVENDEKWWKIDDFLGDATYSIDENLIIWWCVGCYLMNLDDPYQDWYVLRLRFKWLLQKLCSECINFRKARLFGLAKCANTGVVHTILVQKYEWATCHTVFYRVLKGRPDLDPHLDAQKKALPVAAEAATVDCCLKTTVLRGLWWNISGWKKNRGNWWILRNTAHPIHNRSIRIYHLRDGKFKEQSQ